MGIDDLKKRILKSIKNNDPDKLSSIDNKPPEKISYSNIVKKWEKYYNNESVDDIWQKKFEKLDEWKEIGCFQLYNIPEEPDILGFICYQDEHFEFSINSKQLKKILDRIEDEIMILTYIFKE